METPLELSLYALRAYLMSRYTPCVNPSHSRIDALSYQLDFVNLALRRYYEEGAIRLMLADDVGLGKTIMTGLLLKELMLRGHVKRALLVVPRFLKFHWIRELREKFDIECAEELSSNCVVVSIDWLKRHVEEVLRSGGWDVVVFDEAHNLTAPKGRRTTQRYEAASILASSVRNVLLLTATPHHGDQPDFIARLRLLDRGVDERNLRAAVREYVVRRLREDVRDETGIPDRHVAPPVSVALTPEERGFYRGVEEYVLYYYDMSKKRKPLALVAIVFQKRASSSLGAALKTLQRRVETLEAILAGKIAPAERPRKRADVYRIVASTDPEALRREIDKLRELIKLGKSIQRDSKVQKLLEVLTAHKADKAIVFTQYRDTMQYVADALRRAGYKVVTLHGGMDEEQRKAAEQQFRKEGQVLVATDAASEGLNLQIANDLINFDLPWNPSRLDQRIGRVHRYGQKKDVFVYNFVVEDTIDGKVYSVLLRKIEEIRRDLGKVFDYIGNAVDAKAFLQILTRVMEGAKPEDQIEKTVASKATLKDIEDLLTQDRIRIEKDPRCVNYLTGQDLHYVVTATLAQLDPNSYREDGACIKIRYVPAALQPYCRGVCTTDLAGFGIDTPCPEKITAEHPLVQAVFQYHLNKIGLSPYIEAEIERPCYALGTTWVFTAAAELKLPVDVEWREQTYKIEEVKVHFQREVDIAQCSGNVGLDLLTLPVYAAPSREQPPPLPGEAEEEAKTQLMEKIRSICQKVKIAAINEITRRIQELGKKRLPPDWIDAERRRLIDLQIRLADEIDRRCEEVHVRITPIVAIRHLPLGYKGLGMDGAKRYIEIGKIGEEIVLKAEEAEGCKVVDLRNIPSAGVDYISICPSEIRYIETKTVKGPYGEIHITPGEWQTLCANKGDRAKRYSNYIQYRKALQGLMYLYVVDLNDGVIRKFQDPCTKLRDIIQKYAHQQTKYIIPYRELLKILKPTVELKYAV